MKKFLLFVAAVMTANSLFAQEPEVYPNEAFAGVSPNGKYAISSLYGHVAIFDLESGKNYAYEDDYYTGNGNALSNTGVVVGSTMLASNACYWKDGEWHDIASVADRAMSKADGITPDGSRIVGAVAPEKYEGYEGLMLIPCYWDVKADGTLGDIQYLPYPEKDLTGRTPQYITAISVSDDGKTIVGQIQDYTGYICQPIAYRQDAEGKWSYTLVSDDLFHPEGIEIPEYPGDDGPAITDFMTPEGLAAYEQALADWEASGSYDYDIYPNARDFMTEAEIAAYEASSAEFDEKFYAFMEAYSQLAEAVPLFVFNNVLLSHDGKTYATTHSRMSFNPMDWTTTLENIPYLFNLEDGTFTTKESNGLPLILSTITDDGTLLAQKQESETPVEAYILPAGEMKFMTLYDYFATANPTLATWMKENMTREYEAINPETYDFYMVEALATGIPFANADMSVIVLGVENFWEFESGISAYGYIFRVDNASGIGSAIAPASGKAAYYTIDGRRVDAPVKGLNVVKMANGETKKIIVK